MSTASYFLLTDQNETPTGPFSKEQIREMLVSGKVPINALWAVDGAKDWVPLENIFQTLFEPQRNAVELSTPPKVKSMTNRKPLRNWRIFGWILLFLGLAGISVFILMPLSVPTDGSFGIDRVTNLGLIGNKLAAIVAFSCISILGGIFLIIDQLELLRNK